MGCRCCRMIKSYVFGPAIVREVPPNNIRNEKIQNEIKREISTHNSEPKSSDSVISTLDKMTNLSEETSQQNMGIIQKETKLPQEKDTTHVQEGVAKANDKTESKFPRNNLLRRLDSHTVSLEDNKDRATSRGDFSSTNETDPAKDDLGAESGDCTLNSPSTVHAAEVEDFYEVHSTSQGTKEMPDNEVDIVNVRNLSHMENKCMLVAIEKDLKIISASKLINEDTDILNGYKEPENTETDSGKDYMNQSFGSNGEIMLQISSPTNSESNITICSLGSDGIKNVDRQFIKDLVVERKQTTDDDGEEEEEDPEVAAALAALAAATAGEDFSEDWS